MYVSIFLSVLYLCTYACLLCLSVCLFTSSSTTIILRLYPHPTRPFRGARETDETDWRGVVSVDDGDDVMMTTSELRDACLSSLVEPKPISIVREGTSQRRKLYNCIRKRRYKNLLMQ